MEKSLSRRSSTTAGMGPNPICDGDRGACPPEHNLLRRVASIEDHRFNKSADHAREAVGEHVNTLAPKEKKSIPIPPLFFLEALKS